MASHAMRASTTSGRMLRCCAAVTSLSFASTSATAVPSRTNSASAPSVARFTLSPSAIAFLLGE